MSLEKVPFAAIKTIGLPAGEGITFHVWSDDLNMFVHVTRDEAMRLLVNRPDFEFTQEIFGVHNPTMAFLQRKRGAA